MLEEFVKFKNLKNVVFLFLMAESRGVAYMQVFVVCAIE